MERATYLIRGNHGDSSEDVKTVNRKILEYQDVFPYVPCARVGIVQWQSVLGMYSLKTCSEVRPVEFAHIDEVEL